MTYKLAASKPNIDVLGTAGTVPNNLNYSSDYNTLKYYTAGTVNLVVAGSDIETTVTHGLGYVPFFTCFVNGFALVSDSNYNMCPATFSDAGAYGYAQCFADTSKLYFKFYTATFTHTYTFVYKIFRNDLGL